MGGLKKKILDILQKFAGDAFFFKSFTIKITFFCFIDLSNVGFVLVQKTLISFSVGRKILFLNCFFFFDHVFFSPVFFYLGLVGWGAQESFHHVNFTFVLFFSFFFLVRKYLKTKFKCFFFNVVCSIVLSGLFSSVNLKWLEEKVCKQC